MMTTPQKDIEAIVSHSYALVEDYLAMMKNFNGLTDKQKIGDDHIREIVFPVIAQYIGQDTSIPPNILADYLQKKTKHWSPSYFRNEIEVNQREKMLEAFYQSADFQSLVYMVNEEPHYKTQGKSISESEIQKAFGAAFHNEAYVVFGGEPISKQIWPTFVRYVDIVKARHNQPIDMRQYHELQAQQIVETAQKYIQVMEQAVGNGFQMSKERILERREQQQEDTITIETNTSAEASPVGQVIEISKRASAAP